MHTRWYRQLWNFLRTREGFGTLLIAVFSPIALGVVPSILEKLWDFSWFYLAVFVGAAITVVLDLSYNNVLVYTFPPGIPPDNSNGEPPSRHRVSPLTAQRHTDRGEEAKAVFSDTPGRAAVPEVHCKIPPRGAQRPIYDLQLYTGVLIAPRRGSNWSRLPQRVLISTSSSPLGGVATGQFVVGCPPLARPHRPSEG